MSTPAPLAARFIPIAPQQPIILHQPGRTRRSAHTVITGHLLGEMHMRGVLHHLRVAGDDGVMYMAPPSWVAPECRVEISNAGITARLSNPAPVSKREVIAAMIDDIRVLLEERDARRASAPVIVGRIGA